MTIYTPQNTCMAGKPVNAFVNGNLVHGVVFADTERGVVRYIPQPARVHKTKRDQVYTRVLKGNVTVEPIPESGGCK